MALPVFVRATGIYGGGGSSGPALTTPAMATEAGGYLFVTSNHYTSGVNVSAVVDTVGNTFVRAGTVQGGDANQDNEIWYTPNPITGTLSNAVIVKYTAAAAFRDATQCCFSWGDTSSITYYAEASHAFRSASAQASGTLSVADEGLIIGNWVAYDFPVGLSSSTGTIMVGVSITASCAMAVAYRLYTTSSVAATITLVKNFDAGRYSIVAKSFKGVAAGTSTPSTALGITLPLTGAGQG